MHAVVAIAAGASLACAGTPWQGTELDPANVAFAEELGVDLSRMKEIEPGLYVQDLTIGNGLAAGRTSRVSIHYVTVLPDGTIVDSSLGGDPFAFRLGGDEAIEGWDRAIPGMRLGGERIVVARPGLAYGSRGKGEVPPGATLLFRVELVDVR
jgi:FKBP-type peptidyl-prolyl cis-trans isomerase FkpA